MAEPKPLFCLLKLRFRYGLLPAGTDRAAAAADLGEARGDALGDTRGSAPAAAAADADLAGPVLYISSALAADVKLSCLSRLSAAAAAVAGVLVGLLPGAAANAAAACLKDTLRLIGGA